MGKKYKRLKVVESVAAADPDSEEAVAAVNIDPRFLDAQLVHLSGDLWRFLDVLADAKRAVGLAALAKKIGEARLLEEIRTMRAESGVKATEAAIKNALLRHPAYARMCRRELDAEHSASRIQAVTESIRAKKDTLISYAARVNRAGDAVLLDEEEFEPRRVPTRRKGE